MATPRKKKIAPSDTIESDSYNRLEMYCIWLNEYYNALLKAGFKADVAMTIMMDKESYPDWVEWRIPSTNEISKYMDEDED